MLVDEREAVELRGHEAHLEMVSRPGAVLDRELGRVRERVGEQRADRLGFHAAMLDVRLYPAVMRLFRALLLFKLGFWAGLLASAALLKRMFPSKGDADSDEVALVAIFDGVELESHATAFRGGSMFSWFGGIAVDLRGAALAPDAHLTLNSLWGGIAIRVPPSWHVESTAKAFGGGVAISPPRTGDPDAPRLVIDGFALLGGIAIGSKSADAEPTS